MTNRPLINTRDVPHAVSSRYRRLHLILGDANMSAYATALKVGSTSLVLNLIASGEKFPGLELADPVADVSMVSLDKTAALQRKTSGTVTALEIQEAYLEAAENIADDSQVLFVSHYLVTCSNTPHQSSSGGVLR